MAQNDFNPRTDLAVEEREQFTEGEEISGVAVDEWEGERRLRLTRVENKNEQGARAMGKPAMPIPATSNAVVTILSMARRHCMAWYAVVMLCRSIAASKEGGAEARL